MQIRSFSPICFSFFCRTFLPLLPKTHSPPSPSFPKTITQKRRGRRRRAQRSKEKEGAFISHLKHEAGATLHTDEGTPQEGTTRKGGWGSGRRPCGERKRKGRRRWRLGFFFCLPLLLYSCATSFDVHAVVVVFVVPSSLFVLSSSEFRLPYSSSRVKKRRKRNR